MSDSAWFLLTGAVLAALGLVFIGLGLAIWKKRKITLIIRHHMDRVSEEDKPAFCRLCGIGVLAIGAGFVISGICMAFTPALWSWIPMAAGLAAGMLLPAISVVRYNR